MKKVSSVSRGKKLEVGREAGAAKLMKPCSELNLDGRIGIEWVLFCFEGGGWTLPEWRGRAAGGFGGGDR
jgi:hypothetical protein